MTITSSPAQIGQGCWSSLSFAARRSGPLCLAAGVVLILSTTALGTAALGLAAAPARDMATHVVILRAPAGTMAWPTGPPPAEFTVPDVGGPDYLAEAPVTLASRRLARVPLVQAHLAAVQADIERLDPTLSRLRKSGALRRVEALPAATVVLVEATTAAAAELAGEPGVAAVLASRTYTLPAVAKIPDAGASRSLGWNLLDVGADRAWRNLGASGRGVVIATIDSGAVWAHPAIRAGYRGRLGDHAYNWFDATDEASRSPVDPHGHGTQVLGVAVGATTSIAYGVAPGADWIAVRAFDAQGRATDATLLRAGAWILAPTDPEGRNPRPDLAPDVVNGSWALDNGADPLFEPLLDAWWAAGILAVFAAGNVEALDCGPGCGPGHTAGRLRAPAASPQALGVGASVPGGGPWSRSASGPTFGGGLKPDLLAPGQGVMAPLPGGGDGPADGTSLAAPHVTGAAALVLSVAPEMGPGDVAEFLRHSARDAGPTGFDPLHGWGILDVAGAVSDALGAGRLRGSLRGPDGQAVSGGLIRARSAVGMASWEATTGTDGRWSMSLPAGRWIVVAESFDGAAWARTVEVMRGRATQLDLVVDPLPRGHVGGRVRASVGELPASATVSVAGGPTQALSSGAFDLDMPVGRHVLGFSAAGHRAVTRTVQVSADGVGIEDVILGPAPRILVVDSGDAGRIYPYVSRALAEAGYEASVLDLGPTGPEFGLAALPRYQVVFWLHGPGGSPGRQARRWPEVPLIRELTEYVARGGRLVLSGPDLGRLDSREGPSDGRLAPDFYHQVLAARWLGDRPVSKRVTGLGPLAGLELDLRWSLGAATGADWAPDIVTPAEGGTAWLVYPDGRAAAVAASDDELGRRVYLAFGLQQAGGRAAMADLLDRIMVWLEGPSIDLSVEPSHLAPNAVSRVALSLTGGRSAQPLTAVLRLPRGLSASDLPPGMIDTGAGELRWSGYLEAETRRLLPFWVRLGQAGEGGRPMSIGALALSHRQAVTATARVWPLLPDLGASTLTIAPARLPQPGPVTLTLLLRNDGLAAAPTAAAHLALPDRLGSARAEASAGSLVPVTEGLQWRGALASAAAVTVTVTGDLASGMGPARFAARVEDAAGQVHAREAWALVGGPDLAGSRLIAPQVPVGPGEEVTLLVQFVNRGLGEAMVRGRLALPPQLVAVGVPKPLTLPPQAPSALVDDDVSGNDAGGSLAEIPIGPLYLAAGQRRDFTVGLRVRLEGPSGPQVVVLDLDDGAEPLAELQLHATVAVQRPDLQVSRAFLLPERTQSGDLVTGTILLANAGDGPAALAVTGALPPSLSLDPNTVVASDGQVLPGPAGLRWWLTTPAAGSAYQWSLGASMEPAGEGRTLAPGSAFDLGLPFPFHTQVYTRAWTTADGLLLFRPPAGERPTGIPLPPPLAVAPRWASAPFGAPWPTVRREPDRVLVTWPGLERDAGVTATLRADGAIRFDYGLAARVAGAVVGLGADGDGTGVVVLPPEAVRPGGVVSFLPPLTWRWLRFNARVAAGVAPNSQLQHTAWLTLLGRSHFLDGRAMANALSLAPTVLEVWPHSPAPGGSLRYRLRLAVSGQVEARGVEARVSLPVGVWLDGGVLPPGLVLDTGTGDLIWRGRLIPGQPVDLEWTMRLAAHLPVGARQTAVALVRATGVPSLQRVASVTLQRTDFSGSSKRAERALAWPGQVLDFSLRIANAGPDPRTVTAHDALPPGLDLEPGTLAASSGPSPRWDPSSRSLRWQGPVEASGIVELTFRAVYLGGAVTNVMHLDDGGGSVAAYWAEIAEARTRILLPMVSGGRP